MDSPRPILLKYQRDWINDKSKLKAWLKARQIGFSFTATLGLTLDCVSRKTLWLALSASQRQSLELAKKARDHIDAISAIEKGAAGVSMEHERWGVLDGVEITQTLISFPNGARIMFLPARPETVRGFSGNVLGDEFAFHQNPTEIYKAVYPSITRGYRIELGSTPLGESGVFYDVCTKKTLGYSVHTTTIYDAVRDGLAVSVGQEDQAFIDLLRSGVPDEEIWDQEYCCKFISDATSLIPWEMISRAETIEAEPVVWLDDLGRVQVLPGYVPAGRLHLGADIGRRKDLTAIALIEEIGEQYILRGLLRLRNAAFRLQFAVIASLLRNDDLQVRRMCQDASGLGMQLAEELTVAFGTSRVEGVTFNMAVKEDLAVRTRRVFEENRIRIPEDRQLRSALHAVRRMPTAAGHFRFDADRTDAGHADEFWALALALMAADGKPISNEFLAPSTPSAYSLAGGLL